MIAAFPGGIERSKLSPWTKLFHVLRWVPQSYWQRLMRSSTGHRPHHLIICLADHFEPSIIPGAGERHASLEEQQRRLEHWCKTYPSVVDRWRDHDGRPFIHTYFYPAEQYHPSLVDRLAAHCRNGWGEIEIQLHHGIAAPDTPDETRRKIVSFRDALSQRGCLSHATGDSLPRYAFVHGNWALANSNNNKACGVDCEMQILAETGCFADFTLPSAPNPAQVSKINAIYECALPLSQRAPHRRGIDLRRGQAVHQFPLIVQGPLLLSFADRPGRGRFAHIENSALAAPTPPTIERLHLWRNMNIVVQGRPDWIFIKLHCHGMDPNDEEVMLGSLQQDFLRELKEWAGNGSHFRLHFVSAREMVNIILAACDGKDGNPNDVRDYRFRLFGNSRSCGPGSRA
jgi:hypothetical protein